uniref:Peptidase n=1 Tax=Citrus vein enation virus TaxID=1301220 RepID=A0A292GFT0_9VIRU|nr:peptidase [Citrus vein enation virus]
MIKECLATMSSPTTTFSLSTLLTGWELAYLLSLIMLGWAVLHRRERHARNQLAWRFPTSYYVLLLCYGVTLVAAGGVAGSRLRPSLCHAGSTSLGLPISCGTLEFVPLESGLSSPNLTGGMTDVGRSPSLTVRYSPLFHVGSWLQVARQNTTVRVTLRLSFSYLVTAQNTLSGWKRNGLAGMSLLLGCLEPIRMLPAYSVYCLTEALLLTAKCLENAILSWMLLLASALWQLARINPLRTAIWMIVLSLGSFAYENRICRAMIQIILAPVYILPSLGLKFLRVASILPTLLLNWTKNLLIFWLTFMSMMTRRILVGSLMMVRVILRIPLLPIILMKKILGILMMMTPSVETPVADPRLRFVNRERSVSLEGQARQVCLPAVPPKGVIGKVLNANNIQIGYFSCVKLMGGTDGIMVPIHVYEDAHMFMGNNLALSKDAFTVMYRDVEGDVLILKGPPNYRVVLGVKPRLLLTANFARLGFHSLYFERDGQWKVQSANVKGAEDGFLAVVSQTLPGDSGLPLFDTKHRICAMHIGHYGEKRPENMATVVLPIRGFSVPDTEVFKPQVKTTESLYEDDKIFDLVEDLEKEIDEGVVRDLEFEGQHYKTVIGKTSIALLKEAEFLDHMKQAGRDAVKGKQPWSDWLDDEEDERECLRPIVDTKSKYQQPLNCEPQYALGEQKRQDGASTSETRIVVGAVACPVPQPKESKIPSTKAVPKLPGKSKRAERFAQMSPEEAAAKRAAENRRRRNSRKGKKVPPLAVKGPLSVKMEEVSKLVDKKLAELVKVRPRRNVPKAQPASKSSSTASTTGSQSYVVPPRRRGNKWRNTSAPINPTNAQTGGRPYIMTSEGLTFLDSVKSAPVTLQNGKAPPKNSQNGDSIELRPQRSYKPVRKATAGQTQVQRPN